MNDDEAIELITEKLESECGAITANLVITLINKQREEITLLQKQMSKVHKMYCELKRKFI